MQTHGILMMKALAVLSALALGAGYVWYRQQGAAKPQPVTGKSAPAAEDNAAPDTATPAETPAPGSTMTLGQGILSGQPITPLTQEQMRAMMNSSKGGVIHFETQEGNRVVLPGSKSSLVVPLKEEPPRVILSGSKSRVPILEIPEEQKPQKP